MRVICLRWRERSEPNVVLVTNLVTELNIQFRQELSCLVYSSGHHRAGERDKAIYLPRRDCLICGEPELLPNQIGVMLNPTVILRICCRTGRNCTTGRGNLSITGQLPSLTDYLLVSQRAMRAEHLQRHEGRSVAAHRDRGAGGRRRRLLRLTAGWPWLMIYDICEIGRRQSVVASPHRVSFLYGVEPMSDDYEKPLSSRLKQCTLESERKAGFKSAYYAGQIFVRSGGSGPHAASSAAMSLRFSACSC